MSEETNGQARITINGLEISGMPWGLGDPPELPEIIQYSSGPDDEGWTARTPDLHDLSFEIELTYDPHFIPRPSRRHVFRRWVGKGHKR